MEKVPLTILLSTTLVTVSTLLTLWLTKSSWCCKQWSKWQHIRQLPHRIILVRHGESIGNVDHKLYRHLPDSSLSLTARGWEQMKESGRCIQKLIQSDSVRFIISPYVRTMESYEALVDAWEPEISDKFLWSEEPRIREQDFGNFQDPELIRECKRQRKKFGSFFYRFPSGESPADVYDRVSSFLESLHRSFQRASYKNYVLVTHGVTIRVILMRYFRYTVRDFEKLDNFNNAEFVVLEKDSDGQFQVTQVVQPSVDVNASCPDDSSLMTVSHRVSSHVRLMENESQTVSPLASNSKYPRVWGSNNEVKYN